MGDLEIYESMSMAILQPFLVCLCALTVTLAELRDETGEEIKTDDDIFKFLNASTKIWVYNTTEEREGDITCRFDVRYNISAKDTFFYRHNNTSPQELLNGTFVNWNDPEKTPYDAMYVTDMGGNPVTEEVLEYVSSDKRCAVVSVRLMRTDQTTVLREIRVPEEALESEPEDGCKNKFEKILEVAKKNAKSHYSPRCKTMTSPSLAQ
uniref:Putative lipocalin-3 1 n=1 Tax=Amblyomma americanum TaxID=6943 RepID=A0A0C9RXZ3_AMBAM